MLKPFTLAVGSLLTTVAIAQSLPPEKKAIALAQRHTEPGLPTRINIDGEPAKILREKCLSDWKRKLLDPQRAYYVAGYQQIAGEYDDEAKKPVIRRTVVMEIRAPNAVGGMVVMNIVCDFSLSGAIDAAKGKDYQKVDQNYLDEMIKPREIPPS